MPELPSYGNFRMVTKNRPETSPRLNGLRALWRKWHYPPISMHLKVTQNPHFVKKCKGRTKRNFSKIAQKQPSLKKANSTLAEMALSSN